ncbi:MAG: type II secretion system protein [Lachnospiraceae bacterium]|nr:type II secretion system protein [Lachnospiraceae bacterium]
MKLMKLLRKRFAKFGNKGFSLVELICTMAIVSVVGTAVSGVLVVSGDSYKRGTNESELQQEAQLVANQINDLLIDAPSSVSYDPATSTLTIVKDGVTYTVSYNPTTKELMYDQDDDMASAQVMARNVDSFNVDTNRFATTGYAKMNMELSNEGRVYPAVFTISARNKDMTATVAPVVSISTIAECLMEPNLTKNFDAVVTGLTDTTVNWSLYSAIVPTDVNTKFTGKNLKIGANETRNLLRARVATNVVDPGSGLPLAERMVTVKIRRVNTVAFIGEPALISGTDKMAGAEYRLTALVAGNNLDIHADENAADYAAIDPYAINWSVTGAASIKSQGTNATNPNQREVVIKLSRDMVAGETITVKATSAHAAGPNNKAGMFYADVNAEKTIDGPAAAPVDPYIIPGAGWMRMSNQAQGTIDNSIHTLKQSLKDNMPGVVGDLKHRVLIKYREYPGGTYQSNWLPNIYGDADNSMSINLRPLVTGAFDYRKDYEVMLKLSIIDDAGNEIWPIAGVTHDSEYLLVQVMPKVGASFKSNLLGFTETQRVEEAVAPVLSGARRDQQYEIMELVNLVGVDKEGNGFTNGIRFYLDKKTASGYDPVTSGYEIQNQNGKCMITFRTDDYAGTYRIRVQSEDQPRYELNDTTGVLTQNGNMTYVLSNTSTGHNVFHFRVN